MNKKNKTVFVGVSGGVDSSVAAQLLINDGYNVVGVFIRTWTPDFIECTWRDERRDAMRVCAHLGIPYLECDAEEAYKKGVADYMIEEYKIGNTPNPDVMCNREVKFGVFWQFAKERGADLIATGHYANNVFNQGTNKFEFKKGIDKAKDQSYFLWTLAQEDLSHILFPIGHLEKIEVRKLAKKFNLPTAIKKDSQGVCFLGPLDMKEFLKHYIPSVKGDVLDEDGNIIGSHDGAVFFTLGERHGFNITRNKDDSKPLYVVSKNINNNTITVSNKIHLEDNNQEGGPKFVICKTNFISSIPEIKKKYTAQIRYHGEFLNCLVIIRDNDQAEILFEKNVLVDCGQSIVIYDKDICLGGGVIK